MKKNIDTAQLFYFNGRYIPVIFLKILKDFEDFCRKVYLRRVANNQEGLNFSRATSDDEILLWLSDTYTDLMITGKISMSYQEFEYAVARKGSFNYYKFSGYKAPSYTKSPDHKQKEVKVDFWREFKKFKKDKSKRDFHKKEFRDFCKTQSARRHRKWCKESLNNLTYDNFDTHYSDMEYKQFVDKWRWS